MHINKICNSACAVWQLETGLLYLLWRVSLLWEVVFMDMELGKQPECMHACTIM